MIHLHETYFVCVSFHFLFIVLNSFARLIKHCSLPYDYFFFYIFRTKLNEHISGSIYSLNEISGNNF